jgi:hypothetical protein
MVVVVGCEVLTCKWLAVPELEGKTAGGKRLMTAELLHILLI